MNTKVVIQKILLWGLPIVATVLIVLSVYFGLLADKGWKTYPEIYAGNLAIDNQGRIWSIPPCIVRGGIVIGGLSVFANGIWITYVQANSGLPAECVRDIAFDERGQVWIGTDDSIIVFDGNNANLLETGIQLPQNSFINSLNNITDIAVDAEGRTWIGTLDGLSIFDGDKWKNYNEEQFEIFESVLDIPLDFKKRIWHQASGFAVIDGEKQKTYPLSGDDYIFFDYQGRVWISSCETATGDSRLSVIDGEIEQNIRTCPMVVFHRLILI